MRYQYIFAGKRVEICSQLPLAEDERSALFRAAHEGSPDLCITYRRCKALPLIGGDPIWQSDYFRLFAADGKQLIQSLDRRDLHPHMAAVFSPDQPQIELWATEDFPHELDRMQQIWQAVSLPSQLLRCGVLSLHSSSVLTDGGVILFCGRSGIGKSTQAELWRETEGAQVLNGDRNAVTFHDSGALAHGLPFCGTSGICRSYDLPLRAIVALEQSAENEISRLSGAYALQALVCNALGLLPGDSSMRRWELMTQCANSVPIYRLACTPDARAVELLKTTLKEDV